MNKPAKLAAVKTCAALSLLFVAVYGTCNWITAHRSDVGTWYYSWEKIIPFVPLMIVPYMSLDLFYAAAPFLCKSEDELRTLARRIVFAILVAGAFFLLMPLKMAVPRPQSGGWTGAIFNLLHGFDQPYNLFPSLHITLRTILADHYARHTKGVVRATSHVWFSLIGFSTVLTCQHHVVDVIGGFVLAAFCFYLFREDGRRLPVIPNRRVGACYAISACVCLCVALAKWPWTAILLWPALSLAITAAAYWGVGPVIYGKANGRLPSSTRFVLAPCLLGQRVSLLYYRQQCDGWNRVTPRVWIGAQLDRREAAEATRQGVGAVLDLTAEFSEPAVFRELAYCNIPILDLTQMSTSQLRAAADFISQQAARGVVYIHCKVGYSRSAAAAGAYLLTSAQATSVDEALGMLKRVRHGIIFRPEVAIALEAFAGGMPLENARGSSFPA